MKKPTRSRYQIVRRIHEEIGALLRKRYLEKKPFIASDFPRTRDEKEVWERFTDPRNLDVLTEINKSLQATSEFAIALWKKAIRECKARSAEAQRELVA